MDAALLREPAVLLVAAGVSLIHVAEPNFFAMLPLHLRGGVALGEADAARVVAAANAGDFAGRLALVALGCWLARRNRLRCRLVRDVTGSYPACFRVVAGLLALCPLSWGLHAALRSRNRRQRCSTDVAVSSHKSLELELLMKLKKMLSPRSSRHKINDEDDYTSGYSHRKRKDLQKKRRTVSFVKLPISLYHRTSVSRPSSTSADEFSDQAPGSRPRSLMRRAAIKNLSRYYCKKNHERRYWGGQEITQTKLSYYSKTTVKNEKAAACLLSKEFLLTFHLLDINW
ncbi:Protein of unknown function [Gryllus bimaculatus]|nr:Protein of unknown function [Gryllus bimaculatus]